MSTGLRVFRCLRTSSPLEGYHLHLNAAITPTGKSMGHRLHTLRSNLFDFQWNIKALVKAKKLPEEASRIGWLWVLDWLAQVTHDLSEEKKPKMIRNWNRIVVGQRGERDGPITRRGFIAESMMHLKGDEALLASKEKVKALMADANREALMAGDTIELERATGFKVTPTQCEALIHRVQETAQAKPVLEAVGLTKAQQALRTRPIPENVPEVLPQVESVRVREGEATQTAAVEGQGLPPLADLGPDVPVDQVVAPVGPDDDGPAEDGPAEASQVLTSKKKKVINQKKKRQEEKEKREREGTQEAFLAEQAAKKQRSRERLMDADPQAVATQRQRHNRHAYLAGLKRKADAGGGPGPSH